MKILLFGDVVGKPGRVALQKALPELRQKHQADFVIANVENLAHGFGITPETIAELEEVGVDFFTGGNHIWKNSKGVELLAKNPEHILRPANADPGAPGRGWSRVEIAGMPVLIINLLGDVFMEDEVDSPFSTFDLLYKQQAEDAVVIVDFHAEATGEKQILGWHIDGRAAVMAGTHTHVPTADARILPQGTAYITDLGMTGATDSSLGMDKQLVKQKVIEGLPISLQPPEFPAEVVASGVLVTIDKTTRLATQIEQIDHRIPLSYTE